MKPPQLGKRTHLIMYPMGTLSKQPDSIDTSSNGLGVKASTTVATIEVIPKTKV